MNKPINPELNKINICYFPGRESGYTRNRVLVRGMSEAGLNVFDCSSARKSFARYFIAFFRFLKYRNRADIIFVGFFGQCLVLIVRLFTRKKIIFDAFLSAYQTLAFDRRSIKPSGLITKIVRFVEKLSLQLSDIVLLDTNQHINYFLNEYKVDDKKFVRSLVGTDDEVMLPGGCVPDDQFLVHFHGAFQALHGAQFIIEAAALLPEVQFQMIGSGRQLRHCRDYAQEHKLNNVRFIPYVPFDELKKYIGKASLCLGIFGDTPKTHLVIPLKVYEYAAMQKPMVSAETKAIKEIFTHEQDIFLCRPADAKSLAEAIMTLKQDARLRKKISENAYQTFKQNASPLVLGRQISKIANGLLNR